jgi:hypothetical protein
MSAIAETGAPFMLDDGATHYAWVEYDGSTNRLSVSLANTAQRPLTALVTATVDLYAILGSSAFLGFSASCGNAVELAVIESLSIDYRP